MTAIGSHPYELLRGFEPIVNESKGVNRVCYDISKTPEHDRVE